MEYVAAEDADIVVALYTDDSEELMSASGTVDVFAMEENTGHSTVTVPLTGSIPASFIVKAFDGCSDLTTVNYAGSPEQWNNIKIANHNDELLKCHQALLLQPMPPPSPPKKTASSLHRHR